MEERKESVGWMMDRRTDGQTDKRKELSGWMDGWMDKQLGRCMDGWMIYRIVNRNCVDGQKERWTDRELSG